jgi:hypothetical protein
MLGQRWAPQLRDRGPENVLVPSKGDHWVRRVSGMIVYLLTELSPFWEAANCPATQELPSILKNPKVHPRIHNNPPVVPILSQIDPVPTIPSYLRSILILSTQLRLGLPTGSLSFWLSHQYPICIPRLSHSCYMPCPSHPPSLDHSNYVWRGVQVMKLLAMQFLPISGRFISLRSKYSPQHLVLKHPQFVFLP